ncbi:hypothetical protein DLAC_07093 [Tieghemostelium lacteum]|uniref:Cytokinin riboside 5'-monophosphate phosphoribohydrolase n=1 Tax=Tieghemostelium lacteum TaxID=361077 RepID=A0A151ZE61_TIELA|nr:hypothetical protein DLAC_07093 [Tieghemostelium lacteum]|eukprot:KYQ92246.1 hypothetical protein DLAC_07093 [Tieghemostelium lacteum]
MEPLIDGEMAKSKNIIKNICVFCGSRSGNSENFKLKTEQLSKEMTKRGYGLVYGGGNVGLMGSISHGVADNGGNVRGIIPASLSQKEISGTTVGHLEVTSDMHSRKKIMYEGSDAIIALPGGLGTFDELFESLTWIQLGIHSKPVGILNIDGYYTHLIEFLKHCAQSGFVDQHFIDAIVISDDPVSLLDQMETKTPPQPFIKWVKPEQL